MQERAVGDASSCPFLAPTIGGLLGIYYPATVYCRLPNGRVRVPSPEQFAYLCTAGRHHDCPGYRRWKSRSRTSAGRSPSAGDPR